MLKSISNLSSAFFRNKSGSSAVEFAIGAPMLLVGLVIVVDIGLAVNDRMKLDQSVRSGAEFAMNNVEDTDVLEDMVKSSATGSYGSTQWSNLDSYKVPTVNVTKLCECPDSPGVAVTCTTICTGDLPPSVFYDFLASKDYKGIFIPDFTMETTMKVQVR